MPFVKLPRRVEPEWLDELAPEDPRAVRSRCDLRRINNLMTNAAIVARELARGFQGSAPRTIVEIGAGDGTFMLRVAGKTGWRDIQLVLLDRQDIVTDETRAQFKSLGWTAQSIATDVFEWMTQAAAARVDVIVANLFLHHFNDGQLLSLLASAARRAPLLIACEPRRNGMGLTASRLLGLLGCNDVSRHDAQASVHAGFSDLELSGLWRDRESWTLREQARGLFSHCFVARRTSTHDTKNSS